MKRKRKAQEASEPEIDSPWLPRWAPYAVFGVLAAFLFREFIGVGQTTGGVIAHCSRCFYYYWPVITSPIVDCNKKLQLRQNPSPEWNIREDTY